MSRLVPLSLALFLSLGLAACGKRGPLEPPPGSAPVSAAEKADAKKAEKAEAKAGEGTQPATIKLGAKKRVPITPPKRDLLIDRLLD